MPFLYLGFLLGQSFPVAQVIYKANIPPLTIVFSVIVFLIWSFFPVMGYGLARFFGKRLTYSKATLIALGLIISLIEQLLFYYELLSNKDGYVTMLVTGSLFFVIALLPVIQSVFKKHLLRY